MTSRRVLLPGFEYRRIDVGGITINCAAWPPYAPDIRGVALPTGHFGAEEAPGLVVDALRDFLD